MEEIDKSKQIIYDLEIKKRDNEKCINLVKPPTGRRLKKSYITYYNYSLLNNMFVEYFQQNNKNPSKILINSINTIIQINLMFLSKYIVQA